MYTVRTWIAPTLLLVFSAACANSDSKGGIDPSSLTATDNRFPQRVSVSVTPDSATLAVGAKDTLHATVKNSYGQLLTDPRYAPTWSSSDTTIAKVSSAGVVTGVRAGTARITAKSGWTSAVSTITVQGASQVAPSTTAPTTTTTTTPTTAPTTSTTPVATTSTTTTTTTTPVTTSSASGQGVSSVAFLSDNFAEYANTTALLANITDGAGGTGRSQTALYNDGGNATLAQIDPTVLYNGHQTLKYNQPGGVATTPELWVTWHSAALTHIWYRAKLRFSAGFTTTGTLTNSANAYKLLGWTWDTYDGSGRLEITNTTQYQIGWTTQAKDGSGVTGGGNTGVAGNITSEWTDGGWYDYIIEVDYSKSPGVARVWMARDGQTPTLRATSSGTMLNGAALPGLTGIMLGLNFNQTRAAGQTQAVWYGQWEVIDGTQHPNPYGL